TDPDREGEAISWHLAHVLNIPENEVCRVEFNEITEKTVKAAIKTPRTVNMDLVCAQQARRVLDRLVGYKISPLLWAKVRKGLSAGRVQSAACAMIVDRENEINAFNPQEYMSISADMKAGNTVYRARLAAVDGERINIASDTDGRLMNILDTAKAGELAARIPDTDLTVTQVKTGTRQYSPVPPFTTSSLQQDASRKLNFATAKTMRIAQQLYEGVDIEGEGTQGLVSYIITDSTRVSDEALQAVRGYIAERYGADYLPDKPNEFRTRSTAQDAHEAIRPTSILRTPESIKSSLTSDQYKLYRLIYLRFVASQMTPALYDTMNIDTEGGGMLFRFNSQKLKFAGFTKVYVEGRDEEQEAEESTFPDVSEGTRVKACNVDSEKHFTQPPARYTEASLVRAMEEDGIGRPSTYAPIITTLLARGYVSKEGKRLVPNELGFVVTGVMQEYFPDIVDVTFTAGLEEKLDDVEKGTEDWHRIVSEFYGPFEALLEKAERSIERVEIQDEVSDVPCEKCGAMMVYKMGRFGRFLACPNYPACRFTKPIVKYVDAHCPECGAGIIEKMSKKGRHFFGCERYPECSFVSWDMPVDEKCPVCGGRMVQKHGRGGEVYHVCVNEECRERVLVSNAKKEEE
ncbi:MAG: type I DNA topoisomerase, partial [Clostridia bacterium]|nr:type I DNA topoisomerase [Clostridia bacterium]